MFGGDWGKVVAAVALISTFGCLNGWILIQGAIPLAAAKDGLFPRGSRACTATRRTPVFALVVSSLLVSALIVMNYNKGWSTSSRFIILLATLTTIVPYAFAAALRSYLFIFERERFPAARLVRDTVIAALGFAYAIFAIWGTGWDIIGKGFLLLMVGTARLRLHGSEPSSRRGSCVQRPPQAIERRLSHRRGRRSRGRWLGVGGR